MPTLTVTATLFLCGLVLWGLGALAGFREVAVIGAVIVVGVGGVVADTGLEHRAGTVETVTDTNETVVEPQFEPVRTGGVPIGELLMLTGSVLTLAAINPDNDTFRGG